MRSIGRLCHASVRLLAASCLAMGFPTSAAAANEFSHRHGDALHGRLAPREVAAPPIVLGVSGGEPQVAVDAAGIGHVVWNEDRSKFDVLHYCQVAAAARACSLPLTFNPLTGNDEDFDGPQVFLPAPGRVVLLTRRCCTVPRPDGRSSEVTVIYTSDDGGRTFGAPRVISAPSGGVDARPSGDAIFGPGDRISVISDSVTGGTFFRAAPIDGFTTSAARLGDGDSQWYDGTIALDNTETPIVAFSDLHQTFFRRWTGGDYNSASSWTGTTLVGRGKEPRLAGGRSGTFLVYKVEQGTRSDDQYVARRFEGVGFGDPVGVSEIGDPIFHDLFQDGSGRLHAVWLDGSRRLRYRSSSDGRRWSRPAMLSSEGGRDLAVAANSAGRGFVVFGSSRGDDVLALPLEGDCARAVQGTRGRDQLSGSSIGDSIFAGDGDDVLRGGGGDDCLYGERGNDKLVGGPGANVLDGGPGNDVIEARNAARDTIACGPSRDAAHADRLDRLTGCEMVRRR